MKDIEANTEEKTNEDDSNKNVRSNVMKRVVAGTVLMALIATIVTVSIFAFGSSDKDTKSQIEIDNIRTTEMYESLMRSESKVLDERFFDDNITNFLSETLTKTRSRSRIMPTSNRSIKRTKSDSCTWTSSVFVR